MVTSAHASHTPIPSSAETLTTPTVARVIVPKYQIFVSSTFQDLSKEREAVTWEILKAGHIPVGMENFSADDDRGWRVIERTIDATDYYVLILAGRYGSIDEETGLSWTHREYRYALARGVPVRAFVRDRAAISGAHMDVGEGAVRLQAFIEEVSKRRLREPWTTGDDLRAKVSLAVHKAIVEDALDDKPRPGWYRGDALPAPAAATLDEVARLSAENRELRARVDAFARQASAVLILSRVDREGMIRDIHAHRPSITLGGRAPSVGSIADHDLDKILEALVENDPEIVAKLGVGGDLSHTLTTIARTYVLRLKLRNVGNAVARDIRVRLSIGGAEEVSWPRPSSQSSAALQASADVESSEVRGGRREVTLRIPLLGLGMLEPLVPIRLHAGGVTAQWNMDVRYCVDNPDGGTTEGAFIIHRKGIDIQLSRRQLAALARKVVG